MQVILYKWAKRERSTKLPPNNGLVLDAYLKEATSIYEPIFIIEWTYGAGFRDPCDVTYVKAFDQHYYFCNNIVYLNHERVEMHCVLDPYATYRNQILDSTQFVVRYQGAPPIVLDSLNPVTCNTEYSYSVADVGIFNTIRSNWTIIMTVITSSPGPASGFATTYALNWIRVGQLAEKLLSQDFLEQLKQFFSDPLEAIVSAIVLPIPESEISGVSQEIKLLGYSTGISGKRMDPTPIKTTVPIGINWGSAVSSSQSLRGSYLLQPPYVSAYCFLPFVGTVELNAIALSEADDFYATLVVDPRNGSLIYQLQYEINGSIIPMSEHSGTCGASVPVANSQQNLTALAAGAVSTIGALFATGGAAFIAGAGGALAGAMGGNVMTTHINGSLSSPIGVDVGSNKAIMVIERRKAAEGAIARARCIGVPYYRTARLGSLTGYVQCSGASVDGIEAGSDIINTINNGLNGGMWIE